MQERIPIFLLLTSIVFVACLAVIVVFRLLRAMLNQTPEDKVRLCIAIYAEVPFESVRLDSKPGDFQPAGRNDIVQLLEDAFPPIMIACSEEEMKNMTVKEISFYMRWHE
jgi:hypothetical protein